jgi:hypothetical protein
LDREEGGRGMPRGALSNLAKPSLPVPSSFPSALSCAPPLPAIVEPFFPGLGGEEVIVQQAYELSFLVWRDELFNEAQAGQLGQGGAADLLPGAQVEGDREGPAGEEGPGALLGGRRCCSLGGT